VLTFGAGLAMLWAYALSAYADTPGPPATTCRVGMARLMLETSLTPQQREFADAIAMSA
jgi:hypothetical protein